MNDMYEDGDGDADDVSNDVGTDDGVYVSII